MGLTVLTTLDEYLYFHELCDHQCLYSLEILTNYRCGKAGNFENPFLNYGAPPAIWHHTVIIQMNVPMLTVARDVDT